jgi:uncharacterized membrane protein YgcG
MEDLTGDMTMTKEIVFPFLPAPSESGSNNSHFKALALSIAFRMAMLAAAFFLFGSLSGLAAEKGDKITSFESTMVLGKNASLFVDEKINVDFAANQHHGIIREIPCTAQIQGREMRCSINPAGTYCDYGQVEQEVTVEGDKVRMRIGNPNITLSGQHLYEIKYSVDGAVIHSRGNPWLYWNVTGNEWKMPIDQARGTLVLPAGVTPGAVQTRAYAGYAYSQQPGTVTTDATYIYCSAGKLAPGCGLTLSAVLPPGSVQLPAGLEQLGLTQNNFLKGPLRAILSWVGSCWALLLAIVVSAIIFGIGYYNVRQPEVSHDPFDPQADLNSSNNSGSGFGGFGGGSGGGFGGGGGDTW